MNRRLGGDASLNTPIRDDGDSGDWQDWLVDDALSQERVLVDSEELGIRRKALGEALTALNSRERRIFEARRLTDEPITLEGLAEEFGVSRERVRQSARLREGAECCPVSDCGHGAAGSAGRAVGTDSRFGYQPRYRDLKSC
jgi:hypothetical protein